MPSRTPSSLFTKKGNQPSAIHRKQISLSNEVQPELKLLIGPARSYGNTRF
jgi:hypothetical protein